MRSSREVVDFRSSASRVRLRRISPVDAQRRCGIAFKVYLHVHRPDTGRLAEPTHPSSLGCRNDRRQVAEVEQLGIGRVCLQLPGVICPATVRNFEAGLIDQPTDLRPRRVQQDQTQANEAGTVLASRRFVKVPLRNQVDSTCREKALIKGEGRHIASRRGGDDLLSNVAERRPGGENYHRVVPSETMLTTQGPVFLTV